MEALTPWHLALILLGFVLLFGYKRLPDASRSLGRALRIFKSEMRDLPDPDHSGAQSQQSESAPADQSAEALEQQAREAEAEAEALRARARAATAAS